MSSALTLLSSMAVKRLLADLMAMYRHTHADAAIELTSIGGVDAARRVAAGEPFDAVVLGADALEALIASGHVRAGSRIDIARSVPGARLVTVPGMGHALPRVTWAPIVDAIAEHAVWTD